jgi:type IV pilus assembly protein PilM
MTKWKHKKYTPIGLDLAATSLRGVQLVRSHRALHVFKALEVTVPNGADRQNTLVTDWADDPQAVADLLERLVNRGGFVGREVVLHCPAEKLDMRMIEIPIGNEELPREAILGVLKLQMGGKLPMPVEQVVFDYVSLEHDRDRGLMHLMAVSADGDWIKQRIDLVASAGLRCVGVDALAYAQTRLVGSVFSQGRSWSEQIDHLPAEASDHQENAALTALLDIGFGGSTLTVCNHRGPIFCRRFSLGGDKLTDTLAQRLLIDNMQAEKLKRAYGLDYQARCMSLADNSREQLSGAAGGGPEATSSATATADLKTEAQGEMAKAIYTSLQSELNDYVLALTRSLNYVITTAGGLRLEKFLLCGGGAHLKKLADFFAAQFELPVEIISHPLLEEIIAHLPATRAQRGAWATALGLALAKETD